MLAFIIILLLTQQRKKIMLNNIKHFKAKHTVRFGCVAITQLSFFFDVQHIHSVKSFGKDECFIY